MEGKRAAPLATDRVVPGMSGREPAERPLESRPAQLVAAARALLESALDPR